LLAESDKDGHDEIEEGELIGGCTIKSQESLHTTTQAQLNSIMKTGSFERQERSRQEVESSFLDQMSGSIELSQACDVNIFGEDGSFEQELEKLSLS
jgi:hypothetical protein